MQEVVSLLLKCVLNKSVGVENNCKILFKKNFERVKAEFILGSTLIVGEQ